MLSTTHEGINGGYDTFSDELDDKPVNATVMSSSFNLASTMIGLGTVTIPFAFAEAGLLVGCLLLLSVIIMTNISYRLIVRSSAASGVYSYKDLSCQAFRSQSGSGWLEMCVVLYATCSCIAYVRVFGDYVPSLFALVLPSTWHVSETLSMCIAMLFIFPMAVQPNLDSLRVVSRISIIGTALTVTVVVAQLAHRGVTSDIDWVYNQDSGARAFFTAFPLLSVANTGHHNMLTIYRELGDRMGTGRAEAVINNSSVMCFCLYMTIGVAGYLTLGKTTPDNVLVAYTSSEPNSIFFSLVEFARAFLVCVILCTFPKPHFAVRSGLETVFFGGAGTVTNGTRVLLTCATCGTILAVAIFIPSISVAFDVSGSSFGMIMVYLLPPLFITYLTEPSCPAFAVAIYGLTFGVVALVYNVMALAS